MSIKESFTASNAKTGLQMVPLPMYVAKYITVYNSYESKNNFITTYIRTHTGYLQYSSTITSHLRDNPRVIPCSYLHMCKIQKFLMEIMIYTRREVPRHRCV